MAHVEYGVWGNVPIKLLQEKGLTPNALRVYIALASFQGDAASCWPSVAKIAARAGVSRSSVSEATERLVALGWVVKNRRACNSCVYRLVVKADEILESGVPGNPGFPDEGNPGFPDEGSPGFPDAKTTKENYQKKLLRTHSANAEGREKQPDKLASELYAAIQSRASDPKFDKADWLACGWMAGRARELFPEAPGDFLKAVLEEWLELRKDDKFHGRQPWRPKTLRASHVWPVVLDRLKEREKEGEVEDDGYPF